MITLFSIQTFFSERYPPLYAGKKESKAQMMELHDQWLSHSDCDDAARLTKKKNGDTSQSIFPISSCQSAFQGKENMKLANEFLFSEMSIFFEWFFHVRCAGHIRRVFPKLKQSNKTTLAGGFRQCYFPSQND